MNEQKEWSNDELKKYELTCIGCRGKMNLTMVPHHTPEGEMVGFCFVCTKCFDETKGKFVKSTLEDKNE